MDELSKGAGEDAPSEATLEKKCQFLNVKILKYLKSQ